MLNRRPPRALRGLTLPLLMAALPAWTGGAAAVGQEVTLGGQLRTRLETREAGKDLLGYTFVSMRTRVQLMAPVEDRLSVFVQVQDVRTWGEEGSPLLDASADHFDLHQAYAEVQVGGTTGPRIRVGRQEVALGEERLLGAVDWAPQAQSFDGARGWLDGPWGRADVVALWIRDRDAAAEATDVGLVGAQVTFGDGERVLEAVVLYGHEDGPSPTGQTTVGARWVGGLSRVRLGAEAILQVGRRAGRDVSAHAFSAGVGVPLVEDRLTIELAYDHLSGDDRPEEGTVRVFDTLYATNHKFYGVADLFVNIPRDTGGYGLHDLALKGAVALGPSLTLLVDLHAFRLADPPSSLHARLAEEIDVTARYQWSGALGISGGASFVRSGDGLAELGRLEGDLVFAYAMMDVRF